MRVFIVLTVVCAFTSGLKIHRYQPGYDGRIIGGENADIEEVPYQLALLVNGRQNCGASIISKDWALTAAHCVTGKVVSTLSLRAGSVLWNEGGSVHQVVEKIEHPEYNHYIQFDYDYALLKVETPFPIGQPNIDSIELASSDPAGGDLAIISGWGRDYNRVLRLQRVNLPIVDRQQCRDVYGQRDISDRMLCAGWPEGGRNTCNGDSGGPLVVAGRQVGIVSWARHCALKGWPTVFGDVANQREWIRENTGV